MKKNDTKNMLELGGFTIVPYQENDDENIWLKNKAGEGTSINLKELWNWAF